MHVQTFDTGPLFLLPCSWKWLFWYDWSLNNFGGTCVQWGKQDLIQSKPYQMVHLLLKFFLVVILFPWSSMIHLVLKIFLGKQFSFVQAFHCSFVTIFCPVCFCVYLTVKPSDNLNPGPCDTWGASLSQLHCFFTDSSSETLLYEFESSGIGSQSQTLTRLVIASQDHVLGH